MNITPIRPFQSAEKYRGNTELYRRLVRDILAEQRAGRSGFAVVGNERRAQAAAKAKEGGQ